MEGDIGFSHYSCGISEGKCWFQVSLCTVNVTKTVLKNIFVQIRARGEDRDNPHIFSISKWAKGLNGRSDVETRSRANLPSRLSELFAQ